MSEPERPKCDNWDLTGCLRKGGMRKAVRVRQRTFPSETARRLLATMALDSGNNPRALLNLSGGVVGHVKSLIPNAGEPSADDSSSVDSAAVEASITPGNSLVSVDGGHRVVGNGVKKPSRLSNKKKRIKPISSYSIPSKPQMARTFSRCLPKQDVDEFERLFGSFQGVTSCPTGCNNGGIDPNAVIIKTKVVSILWALQRLYGIDNVVCERAEEICGDRVDGKVFEKNDYLEIVAMDAVLARTMSPPRAVTGTETVDTPVRYLAPRKETLDPKYDPMFRAFVVVVPDGATYYSHRERRRACIGVANALIPMDTSWLRAKRNGNSEDRFALGSYVSRLWEDQPFWKFKISRGDSNFQLRPIPDKATNRLSWDSNKKLKVLSAYQMADEVGPALPPDYVNGVPKHEHWYTLRRAYREAVNHSRSSKRGCRHYAKAHLHYRIDPKKTLVIDSRDGDMDLWIATQVKRAGDAEKMEDSKKRTAKQCGLALSRESVVHIRNLLALGSGGEKLVNDVWEHASTATKGNQQSARRGLGDDGSMHPIGMRIMKDNKTRTRYKTSRRKCEQRALRKAVIASARLAAVTIPGILRLIQDVEEDGDISPPEGEMNGDGACQRVSFTMDVSFDLANASHFDVNDASQQGFSIWTEDEPGWTKEWYFVLPNVYGKRPPNADGTPGEVFHGVAIKLAHGVLISWDGRVIRHCTSMMERGDDSKHVYGSFFAAKSSVVAYGARMAFVRESLRRYHAKLERRHLRRSKKGGSRIVEKGEVGRGESEGGDGGALSKNVVIEVENLMAARIPRKGKSSDSVTAAGSGLEEKLLDDEESWSDFTYASSIAGSSVIEDGGTILDRIPFVEFVERDLDGNNDDVARLPAGGMICDDGILDRGDRTRRQREGDCLNSAMNSVRLPVCDTSVGDGRCKRSRFGECTGWMRQEERSVGAAAQLPFRPEMYGRGKLSGPELHGQGSGQCDDRNFFFGGQAVYGDNGQLCEPSHAGRLHVRGSQNGGDNWSGKDCVGYTECDGDRKRSSEDQSWRQDLYGRERNTGRRELNLQCEGELNCQRESRLNWRRESELNRQHESGLNWRHGSELNWRHESELNWRQESELNWRRESDRFRSQAAHCHDNRVDRPRDCQWRGARVDSFDLSSGFSRGRGPENLPSREYRRVPGSRIDDVAAEWDEETNTWRYFRR